MRQNHLDHLSPSDTEAMLHSINVSEVWGVGRRITQRLADLGIHTVAALRAADAKALRQRFHRRCLLLKRQRRPDQRRW